MGRKCHLYKVNQGFLGHGRYTTASDGPAWFPLSPEETIRSCKNTMPWRRTNTGEEVWIVAKGSYKMYPTVRSILMEEHKGPLTL